MTKELISYEESRLAFFEQQLAGANRKLDWAIKHKSHWDCAEKGEIVSFYQDIVKMLREQAEREKGCEYCKVLTPDCCGGFFLPSIDPDCEADMVTITHCPMCGKRLEAQP